MSRLPRHLSLLGLTLVVNSCFSPSGGGEAGTSTATPTEGSTSGENTTLTGTTSTSPGSASTTLASTSGTTQGCGDGVLDLEMKEECDDGNLRPGDGCSSECTKEFRRVFVTSELFSGNLGGVAGADAKCQAAAMTAKLTGEFKAWVSTDSSSPVSTFIHSTVPYQLVGGQIVAKNWDDLVDDSLMTGIYLTESGQPLQDNPEPCGDFGSPVWTNSSPDGTVSISGMDCNAWTASSGVARAGLAGATLSDWTQFCEADCLFPMNLYCFEQ